MIASDVPWWQIALSQLWQVTLLAIVIGILVRLFARQRPHLAYLLWLLVLLKCVMPPLASSPTGVFSWLESLAHWQTNGEPARDGQLAHAETHPAPIVVQVTSPTEHPAEVTAAPITTGRWLSISWRPFTRPLPILAALWLTGFFTWLAICYRRWRRCVRMLRNSQLPVEPQLAQQFGALQAQLGIRRSARLMITSSRLGPIVMGVWRPTVVLPAALLRERSADYLRPILAHELLHVRRGDLWWGWLQLVAQGVWWFHPLVWWVNRQTSREMERCCDEEVVAETGCSPGDYARALLAVLERKHELAAAPAFPGVRSVEITSQRLERIMKRGHGCHKRTPQWCWWAMLLLALATLPGAALVLEAEEKPAAEEALVVKVYDVAEHLKVLHEQDEHSDESARLLLVDLVRMTGGDVWTDLLERRGDKLIAAAPIPEAKLAKRAGQGSWEWDGERLIVRQTQAGHRHVVEQLALVREHGAAQLLMEFRILKGPMKFAEEQNFDWKLLLDAELSAEPAPATARPEAGQTVVRATVSKHFPCHHATIDDAQAAQLLKSTQATKTGEMLAAPKVVVMNGQSATIAMQEQRPYVVAVKEIDAEKHIHEPVIRVVTTGTTINVRGKLTGKDRVQLSLGIVNADVSKVQVAAIAKDVNVQIPELSTTQIESTFELPLDGTLVLTGLPAAAGGKSQPMTVLVRVSRAKPEREEKIAPPERLPKEVDRKRSDAATMQQRVYEVGDLLLLPRSRSLAAFSIDLTQTAPKCVTARTPTVSYEDLVSLLKDRILPATWDQMGGNGSIQIYRKRESLVILQSDEVHEAISSFITQLRRTGDLKFRITLDSVEIATEDLERLVQEEHGETFKAIVASEAARPLSIHPAVIACLRKGSSKYTTLDTTTLYNGQPLAMRGSFLPHGSAPAASVLQLRLMAAPDLSDVWCVTRNTELEQDQPPDRPSHGVAIGRDHAIILEILAAEDGQRRFLVLQQQAIVRDSAQGEPSEAVLRR